MVSDHTDRSFNENIHFPLQGSAKAMEEESPQQIWTQDKTNV